MYRFFFRSAQQKIDFLVQVFVCGWVRASVWMQNALYIYLCIYFCFSISHYFYLPFIFSDIHSQGGRPRYYQFQSSLCGQRIKTQQTIGNKTKTEMKHFSFCYFREISSLAFQHCFELMLGCRCVCGSFNSGCSCEEKKVSQARYFKLIK